MVSMQGLGYKESCPGWTEITLEEAVYILKRDTRHFAKRRSPGSAEKGCLIWSKKQTRRFSYNEDAILEYILKICEKEEFVMQEMENAVYRELGISSEVLAYGNKIEELKDVLTL